MNMESWNDIETIIRKTFGLGVKYAQTIEDNPDDAKFFLQECVNNVRQVRDFIQDNIKGVVQ